MIPDSSWWAKPGATRTRRILQTSVPSRSPRGGPVSSSFPSLLISSSSSSYSSFGNNQIENKNDENAAFLVLEEVKRSMEDDLLTPLKTLCADDVKSLLVLVSVSGGADSVALLLALMEVYGSSRNEANHWEFHIVHFHHEQRGAESDGDADFVQHLAQNQFGLAFHMYHWHESQNGSSFSQETARDWRRTTLMQLAQDLQMQRGSNQHRPTLILTGHHKNDDLETILLQLLRGSHLTRLGQGMSALSQPHRGVFWGKPLLHLSKAQLEAFLQCRHQSWRVDSSNASLKYQRNRLRHDLMPLLEDFVGGAAILEKRLYNLQEQSEKINRDLTARAQDFLVACSELEITDGWDTQCDTCRYFHLPLSKNSTWNVVEEHALYLWLQKKTHHASFSYEQVMLLCRQLQEEQDSMEWRMDMGQGWTVIRMGDVLDVLAKHHDGADAADTEFGQRWSLVDATAKADGETSRKNHPKDRQETETDDSRISLFRLLVALPWGGEEANDDPDDDVFLSLSRVGSWKKNSSASEKPLLFLPPWRTSPIKLNDFLRQERVAFHRRLQTPILTSCSDQTVVAVFVEGRRPREKEQQTATTHTQNVVEQEEGEEGDHHGSWVIHKDFDPAQEPSLDCCGGAHEKRQLREILIQYKHPI